MYIPTYDYLAFYRYVFLSSQNGTYLEIRRQELGFRKIVCFLLGRLVTTKSKLWSEKYD